MKRRGFLQKAGLLALAMCYVLGSASRVFHADVDAKVQAIPEAVAGANRGACRFPGCEQRAEAVAKREAEVDSVQMWTRVERLTADLASTVVLEWDILTVADRDSSRTRWIAGCDSSALRGPHFPATQPACAKQVMSQDRC
jgi:hypothetical protein